MFKSMTSGHAILLYPLRTVSPRSPFVDTVVGHLCPHTYVSVVQHKFEMSLAPCRKAQNITIAYVLLGAARPQGSNPSNLAGSFFPKSWHSFCCVLCFFLFVSSLKDVLHQDTKLCLIFEFLNIDLKNFLDKHDGDLSTQLV